MKYSKNDIVEVVSLTGKDTSQFAKDKLKVGDIVEVHYEIGVCGSNDTMVMIVVCNVYTYLDTQDIIMKQPATSNTNTISSIHKPENPSQLDSVVYPKYTPQEF